MNNNCKKEKTKARLVESSTKLEVSGYLYQRKQTHVNNRITWYKYDEYFEVWVKLETVPEEAEELYREALKANRWY